MSILKYIKIDKCPICGCDQVIKESIGTRTWGNERDINTHSNGTRVENREFLCGYESSFVPNYKKELSSKSCMNDPEIIARKKKEKSDKELLKKFMTENNIDRNVLYDTYYSKED